VTGSLAPKEFVGLRAIMYSLYAPGSPRKSHKKGKWRAKKHVTNLSRLVSGRTKHDGKIVVCLSCLHPFSSHGALDAHAPCCAKHTPQQIIYPDANNERDCTLEFRAYRKQHRIPFYLVSDLESFWKPVSGDDESFSRQVSDDDDDNQKSATKIIDEHCVSGFASYRVTDHEQYQTEPTVYSGPDDMKKFYEHVMRVSDEPGRTIKAGLDMTPLAPQEQSIYDAATVLATSTKPSRPLTGK